MSKKTIRGLVGEENGALYIKLGGFWFLIGEKSMWVYRNSFAEILKAVEDGWLYAWKDSQMNFSKRPAIREFSCG